MRLDLRRAPPNLADIKRILEMRSEKVSWKIIGKRLGFSEATMKKALRQVGK